MGIGDAASAEANFGAAERSEPVWTNQIVDIAAYG